MTMTMTMATTMLLVLALGDPALAREGDAEACEGLEDGDDCTRDDGDPGLCQPDDSDPGVLVCDDDGLGSSSDGVPADCSVAGGAAAGWLALGLAAAAIGRRGRVGRVTRDR